MSESVGGHQRPGRSLARRVEEQRVRDADHLEQAEDGTRRADDHERAVLATKQGSGAEQHAQAAGIEELDVAEVQDNAPAVSRIAASSARSNVASDVFQSRRQAGCGGSPRAALTS